MKKYRLKRDAVRYYPIEYSESVLDFYTWDSLHVHECAIEEINPVKIQFAGFNESIYRLHFDIIFPNMSYREYHKLKEDFDIKIFENKIQEIANSYFKNYITEL